MSDTRHPTIYEVLKAKLGREPTHRELCDDVARIIRETNNESLIQRAKQHKAADTRPPERANLRGPDNRAAYDSFGFTRQ